MSSVGSTSSIDSIIFNVRYNLKCCFSKMLIKSHSTSPNSALTSGPAVNAICVALHTFEIANILVPRSFGIRSRAIFLS